MQEELPYKNISPADPKEHWHTQLVFISSISTSIMEINEVFDEEISEGWQVFTAQVK